MKNNPQDMNEEKKFKRVDFEFTLSVFGIGFGFVEAEANEEYHTFGIMLPFTVIGVNFKNKKFKQ